jgi:hypothetical protein
MAVTKQTYTAAPTWTAADLATTYRSAFIDAGLMTDWHDSFLSGSIENRVLRIQYDVSKTYGTTFYWFQFSTAGAFLHVATGWNTSTDVPTGTQYLDFFSTTTNATSNHWQFSGSLSATTAADLIRYSSGSHHWFVSRQGTTRQAFTIQPASHTLQSWINLDRGFYTGFASLFTQATGTCGASMTFNRGPALRRDVIVGPGLVGSTTAGNYSSTSASMALLAYVAPRHVSNSYTNNISTVIAVTSSDPPANGSRCGAIVLPVGFSTSNPAYTTNSNPVFHSMPFTPYSTTTLNSDFGITFHYATNVFGFQDKFIVTAGTEEWETLAFSNASVGDGTTPSVAFLARVV